jgi:aldose 1-epimerase
MYSIKEDKFGDFTKITVSNNKGESFTLVPEFGATIIDITLSNGKKNYPIIEGYTNYEELIENKGSKSKKMVPFPNRIPKGEYSFMRKTYDLPINKPAENCAIHGLVYDKEFTLKKHRLGKESGILHLQYIYKKIYPGYPFQFKLDVFPGLKEGFGFSCVTQITNLGKSEMPIADGFHPYYKTKEKVDELYLQIPSTKKINVDKRLIPTGKTEEFSKFKILKKIGKHKFDAGFILKRNGKENVAKVILYDKKEDLEIIPWQQIGKGKYNYLQIYIPKDRKSIAIEPMTCMTNGFNNKKGLIILRPKEVFDACYGVQLNQKF